MSNNKIVIAVVGFTLAILVAAIFAYVIQSGEERNILLENNYTIGYFLSYYEQADSGTPIVDYYYIVKGKKYYGNVYTDTKYNYCKWDISCKEKKFWVLYSSKKPNSSLIDLSQEVNDLKSLIPPKTKENFK